MKEGENARFAAQEKFLKGLIAKDGALIGFLVSTGCFVFSLFLTWSQARSEIDLDDKGYATGWSEGGYIAASPFLWVIYSILKDRNVRPRSIFSISAISISVIVFLNVVNRVEWINREYTTTIGEHGGSWRNYTGRIHSTGSDLGAGFWIGLASLLTMSILSLIWSLHRFRNEATTSPAGATSVGVSSIGTIEAACPQRPVQTDVYHDVSISDHAPYEKLSELAKLKDRGVITPDEFQQQKSLILGTAGTSTKGGFSNTALAVVAASTILMAVAVFSASRERQHITTEHVVHRNMQSPDAAASPPVADEQASEEFGSADPGSGGSNGLTKVGECKATLVASISSRLDGEPDSGSAISYSDGTSGVSYETVAGVVNSRVDDPISICLESVPQNCPVGDERGRVYKATNLRTNETWSLPDSSHSCGGA